MTTSVNKFAHDLYEHLLHEGLSAYKSAEAVHEEVKDYCRSREDVDLWQVTTEQIEGDLVTKVTVTDLDPRMMYTDMYINWFTDYFYLICVIRPESI